MSLFFLTCFPSSLLPYIFCFILVNWCTAIIFPLIASLLYQFIAPEAIWILVSTPDRRFFIVQKSLVYTLWTHQKCSVGAFWFVFLELVWVSVGLGFCWDDWLVLCFVCFIVCVWLVCCFGVVCFLIKGAAGVIWAVDFWTLQFPYLGMIICLWKWFSISFPHFSRLWAAVIIVNVWSHISKQLWCCNFLFSLTACCMKV